MQFLSFDALRFLPLGLVRRPDSGKEDETLKTWRQRALHTDVQKSLSSREASVQLSELQPGCCVIDPKPEDVNAVSYSPVSNGVPQYTGSNRCGMISEHSHQAKCSFFFRIVAKNIVTTWKKIVGL